MLDELPDAVTVQSETGLVYANRESLRLLGFETVEELVATPIEEFIRRYETFDALGRPYSPEDLPGRRVLRGEDYAEELLRNVTRATGEESWRLVQARPLETEEGRLAINVLRDLTELKHAESGLRYLVDVSAALMTSLDIRESLAAVADVLVPELVDAVVVEREPRAPHSPLGRPGARGGASRAAEQRRAVRRARLSANTSSSSPASGRSRSSTSRSACARTSSARSRS